MENLNGIIERAELVALSKNLSEYQKDVMLADIMTDMEKQYKIPMFQDPEWEAAHQDVIKTYKKISDMRSL